MGTLRAVGDRWTVSHLIREFELAPGGDRLGSSKVSELTPALLAGAATRWRSTGLSDHQVRARVATIRSVVGWAIAQDYLARNER